MREPTSWFRSWTNAIRYATRRAQATGIRHRLRKDTHMWGVNEIEEP